MTRFHHQLHSGRHKKGKKRKRQPMGLGAAALVAHRELEYLRHPTKERAAKLKAIKRGKL